MQTLLVFSDILCIQEHFLLDCKDKKSSNTNLLRKKFDNEHDMYILPATKSSSQISRGRGKGGLATVWKKGLTKYVSRIETSSFRVQGTKFSFPSGPIVVVNVYFPCDPQNDYFDDTELISLLEEIKSVKNIV